MDASLGDRGNLLDYNLGVWHFLMLPNGLMENDCPYG